MSHAAQHSTAQHCRQEVQATADMGKRVNQKQTRGGSCSTWRLMTTCYKNSYKRVTTVTVAVEKCGEEQQSDSAGVLHAC